MILTRLFPALFALIAIGSVARSAERGAALPPALKPAGAVELRDRFHDAIARGLRDAGVIPAAETRARLAAEGITDCVIGGCVQRAATVMRAPWVITSEIQVTGKDYVFHLLLIDGNGRLESKVDEPCDICTVKEADEALARASAKLSATAAHIALQAERPAPVMEAPKPKPKPLSPPPPLPPPVLSAPPTIPVTSPAPLKRSRPFLWAAVGSAAAGVVGLVVGIPLLAIDGTPTCSLPSPQKSCANLYDTMPAGAVLTTLGVAGLAASGVLFYLDYRSQHRAKRPMTAGVAPTLGGAILMWNGNF